MFKSLFLTTLVLFTQTASADIPAPPSMGMSEEAGLTVGAIDTKLLHPYVFAGATVRVNFARVGRERVPAVVNLRILRDRDCPPGRACTREVPAPIVSELNVTKVERGTCGETVITASHDDRPVDGIFQEIVITDYRSMICKMFIPNPTHVTYRTAVYDRIRSEEVTTESHLEGERFLNRTWFGR